ncbi:DoxX family protein [Mycobacterium sp.]|jgi:putative oxidoreductase|uniref:DoxX family protein n=1 Tax=Mycobacterium sp. TaxID=1785 RepID=UPI002D35033A|nr:DoxX family protein [Mycobacterium sp.]HZA08520.1 DoxX family protein [Mycobacterium sp.]
MTTNLEARLSTYSPTVLSIFRFMIGLLFTLHGTMGLFNWPLALPMQIHVGDWPGWWASLIEFVTGLLVMIGLFTRPAAFLASGTMAVAYFWQHWPFNAGPKVFWPFDRAIGGNSGELAILFCFSFLLILFAGPGAYAIDSRRRPAGTTAARGGYADRGVAGWRRRFARR